MRDRRRFVAAAAATLGLGGRTYAKAAVYDVVIIGAGVAGLTAARRLQALGRSFVVLEACDRIGGRAWTQDFMGVPVDRGAHWLHSADINPLRPVAQADGAQLRRTSRAEGRLFSGPGRLATGAEADLGASDVALESAFAEGWERLGTTSLAEIAAGEGALSAKVLAFAIGEEPERIAASDVAMLDAGGADLEIEGGLGAFVRRFGADVPVRLGARVEHVDWSKPGRVKVSGAFGEVQARACLVTAPPAVLAAGAGPRFHPPLPLAKQEAIARLPMGVFTKVALRLDRPMPDLPLYSIDSARLSRGELHALHCGPGDLAATLMLGGDAARAVIAAGSDAAVAEAQAVLAAVAGASAVTQVRGGLLSEWRSDPFSLGSYAYAPPGAGDPRRDFAMPVEDRLFFAGDTVGGDLAMTVGGAYRSGKAAAEALNQTLA